MVRSSKASNATAAVDFERDTGNDRRFIAAQEGSGRGDVLRSGKAAKRDGGEKFRADLRRVFAHESLEHGRFSRDGIERVDADAKGRELHRHRAGGGDYPAFRRVVA